MTVRELRNALRRDTILIEDGIHLLFVCEKDGRLVAQKRYGFLLTLDVEDRIVSEARITVVSGYGTSLVVTLREEE